MVEAVEKKRKVSPIEKNLKASKIFSPFRVVGNVTNETPFALGTLGSTFYIVTSVGRSFQIYDAATLHLLFVSQTQTPSKINCLAAHFHYVYAAYNNEIGIYRRGQIETTLKCSTEEHISSLLVFGDFLIASSTDGQVFVFRKLQGSKLHTELYTTLNGINPQIDGDIVGIVHPPTYLNKIVVATSSHIFVFNIRTGKLLFKSPVQQFLLDSITAIEVAPVLDLVAIGTATGGVYLYHLKKGKILGTRISVTAQDVSAKVTSLSFRTDGAPHIVVGLNSGDLYFYDLEKQTRVHILRNAHKEVRGGVSNVKFLNGQPILVTNGGDNQLKEYVFDPTLLATNSSIVSPPRHLRSRGGHSSPPTAIEFPQEDKTHFLYSASKDRSFWSFSLRKDAQAQELSQRPQKSKDNKRQAGQVASMREKHPEITTISSSQLREGQWDNIVTVHKDEPFARTWDSKSKRIGVHQLATIDNGNASTVCVSQCGNFAIVGSTNGGFGVYNLQSGTLRKKYVLHTKAVTGIAIDGMNRSMVSCGLDGIIGFYNFSEHKYLAKLQLEAPITSMIYQKSSDLIACALDDLSIVVVDVISQKVVRILYGHTNRITSLDFSPDGKWIVSVSLDGTLRTWDLATGLCIDGIRLPVVATHVKFTPLGEMLATTHVSGNGVFLWTNRAQFKQVSTRQVEESEFSTILMPNVSGDGGATIIEGALDTDEEDFAAEFANYASIDQIDESLVTLSLGSRSKYNTILHLDVIKQRSKPKEAPIKPKNAPFFLQLSGEAVGDRAIVAEEATEKQQTSSAEQLENNEDSSNGSRLLKLTTTNGTDHHLQSGFESEFTKLLRQGKEANDYLEFLSYLYGASPSTVDLEIRSLQSIPPLTEMTTFISAITQGLLSNTNYDLAQAIVGVFLKAHGDIVYNNSSDEEFQLALTRLQEVSVETESRLQAYVKYCSGVFDFLSSV
ncbi:uncharacterized protein KQ657_002213 [Scheffersomyces spartinae]|uniref:Small-subunit processome Utp21 domain-containing protein n=1 Tax=Scheffersomyces spartinae TaxID=45513 RepID=A0A9P8AKG6_9ASCO|nr:uncharacterized protein KQ657_002213 [Scheffersomyces spartinae]KAG7195828.1 hypothetical protein KQ657_002213 [Scheffersomyces spartinae]